MMAALRASARGWSRSASSSAPNKPKQPPLVKRALTGKPALVCGPDMSGKAAAVRAWCLASGAAYVMYTLTPECTLR